VERQRHKTEGRLNKNKDSGDSSIYSGFALAGSVLNKHINGFVSSNGDGSWLTLH